MDRHGFLRLVTERNDPTLTRKHVCPYCGSKDLIDRGGHHTLVGGPYNHFTYHCTCNSCGELFEHHWKENGKHWKTGKIRRVHWYIGPNRKVLAGIPGCFEPYVLTCKHCGGPVEREEYRYEGVVTPEQARLFAWYRFTCASCKRTAKSERSHWAPPAKPGPKPPPRPPGQKPRFFVKEMVGMGAANLGAIKNLTLETP